MKNILFYKYVDIADPEAFQQEHYDFCKSLNLLGKILVSTEGINGCVSGSDEAIETYKEAMHADSRFSDVVFKEAPVDKHTFKKMFVRVRKEIVTSEFIDSIEKTAPYVEPHELKEWLESGEDVILIDARNNYESAVGKFTGAITPDIDTFKEWPQAVADLEKLKNKKIVTYCTGGIRCEKASAYMREQGFKNVYQLHGGIIQYGKDVGNDHWEGKCFVFDKRGVVDIDPKHAADPITICQYCRTLSADYHNCENVDCDKRFIACSSCNEQFEGCCSKGCRAILVVKQ